MLVYFVGYTMVDRDDRKWDKKIAMIYKTEDFIEDLSSLQRELESKLVGDFVRITINTMNFLHEIPDKTEISNKKYID